MTPLPISPADARAVLAALGIDAPPLELESYDVADLAGTGSVVTLVPVHKSRRRSTFQGCMAELTDVRTAAGSTRTIAVESEDAGAGDRSGPRARTWLAAERQRPTRPRRIQVLITPGRVSDQMIQTSRPISSSAQIG